MYVFSWPARPLLRLSPEDRRQPAGYHGRLCGEALREEPGLPGGYHDRFCGEALQEEAGLQRRDSRDGEPLEPRVSLAWLSRGVMSTSVPAES